MNFIYDEFMYMKNTVTLNLRREIIPEIMRVQAPDRDYLTQTNLRYHKSC